MSKEKNRWLLPNGIDELVAADARTLEALRRSVLDLFDCWGYDLVFPPIIEFSDALLTGLGENLDLQTFKFSDYQSGNSLGLRADISPQVARIDAHSMNYEGANRLCYAGTIVRANPSSEPQNRAPVQIGAELFGIEEIQADFEIVSLMLATLQSVTDREITLEVSHQSVRAWLQQLAENAGLNFNLLCELVCEKRLPELDEFLNQAKLDSETENKLRELPRLMGDTGLFDSAKKLFAQESLVLDALAEMELLAERIKEQFPEVNMFFNLSEIQSSDYHSGLIFSAYCEENNVAMRLANGGRYNEVGAAFGRARPATGFSADLKILAQLLDAEVLGNNSVYAEIPQPEAGSWDGFWEKVESLREQGSRVKLGYPSERNHLSEYDCSQQLVEKDGDWVLVDFH